MKPTSLANSEAMPVTLSIKNVPDDVAAGLRARAERNHRSLQGELLAIVSAAAREPAPLRLDALEVLARVRAKLPRSPDESADLVRQMRDERANRRR
jgi:plasmid stability protein